MEKLVSVRLVDPAKLGSMVEVRIQGPTVVRNIWMTPHDFLGMVTGCLQFTGQDLLPFLEGQEALKNGKAG